MGAVPYALGRQLQFYVKTEGSFKDNFGTTTQTAMVAEDACKVTNSTMEFSVAREERVDSRSTRSSTGFITGKEEITWSCETYINPRGVAGTPSVEEPDAGPLLQAAFGATFASNTYELTDGTNELGSLHMARGTTGIIREDVFGAWVDEFGLSVSGGDIPKMTFSGGAAAYALTAYTQTSNSGTAQGLPDSVSSPPTAYSANPIEVDTGHNLMPGSRVTVGSDARTVVYVDGEDITVSSASDWANDASITPYFPAETTHSENCVAGISGSLTMGGTTVPIVSFDVTLNNGIKPVNDLAFQAGATDFIPMARTVTGTISVRANRADLHAFTRRNRFVANAKSFTEIPIVVTLGEIAGQRCVITMPKCELNFGSLDIPESEEAVLNIPYTAIATSAKDEIEFKWNQT